MHRMCWAEVMEKITKTQLVKTISGIGVLGFLSTGAIATAQVTVFEGLPPLPPEIPTLRETPEDEEIEALRIEQPPALNEFNFEAPTATTPSRAVQNGYRVEVPSNNREVLEVVRTVEPGAFVRGDRIQAGLFSDQNNARALQSDLQLQGLNANIVSFSGGTSGATAIGSSVDSKGYFVAIPIRGSSISLQNQILNTGISANLIQERESSRGDYISIGPFSNRQEANSVNSQVRAASLDGRLYFRK